ncbi:TRAP transporter substrate-binding protein DctP [Fusobacterium ulcerans]|uniref:TRAP transporter substrate-binding protein DctP n=1 Tax=Fusobacterium ulcerans TaxID=861 RepID=UPI002673B3AF|nr:TRAP transporter substrate-binding protein DctP [Fusobacterium ulcerans]
MNLKKVLLSVIIISNMVMFTGCGKEKEVATLDKPITLKLALVDPESSNFAKGANKIAEEVETATNGKIKIEVYAGGSLGGERDTIELAMGNNLDIAIAANSVLTNFIPEMGILDQPYLWTNSDEAHAAVDGHVGDLVKREALKQGLHIIGFMESGYRNTFSTKPIKSMEDFKGVTIRTMENKYHQAAFESFGAMPIAMSYNDVFTALQQKTIDAAENATANCLASGYYEVTKFITNSQHAYVYMILCMSDTAWKKIPEDLQQPFLDAVQKGVIAQRQYLVDANNEATEELKAKGVEFFDIDTIPLQAAYKAKVIEKGFTFDKEWEAAVQEAIDSVK